MKKVALFTDNKILQYKISTLLSKDNYDISIYSCHIDEFWNITSRLSSEIVIISGAFLQGRSQLLDMLVNSKRHFVIYLNQNIESGKLYNVYQENNFLALKEECVEALPNLIEYGMKMLRKIELLENKLRILELEREEEKHIKEAKLLLMKQGYTEPSAHKYITQKAMQLRKTKGQVAKMIKERVLE